MQYPKQSYNRFHTVDGSSSSACQLNGKIFSSASTSEVVHHQSQIQHSSSNGSSKTDSSRDSGTSSPQPNEIKFLPLNSMKNNKMSIHIENADHKLSGNGHHHHLDDDEDTCSNDSVFSDSSMEEDMIEDESKKQVHHRDIYLGGSCALRTSWRQDTAIPYLKSRNISYHLPKLHENFSKEQLARRDSRTDADKMQDEDDCGEEDFLKDNGKLIYDPNILDSSRVLLFIITNKTRSLAPMTLAAHYIGLGYNVVLCVQMLDDGCKIGNDKVSFSFLI